MTNAGASQLAGELCSPYVFSTSWNNDQTPAAIGRYMNQKGVKTAFLLGPNYAAGKTCWPACRARTPDRSIGQELTRWPDQLDFSAELSKARAMKPDAIFAFYPGASGIQFLTQYAQAGLRGGRYRSIRHSSSMICRCRGSKISPSACPVRRNGSPICPIQPIRNSSPTTRRNITQRRRSMARRLMMPVGLIDSAVTAVKGDLSDKEGMRKEMEKAKLQVGARRLQIRQ